MTITVDANLITGLEFGLALGVLGGFAFFKFLEWLDNQ